MSKQNQTVTNQQKKQDRPKDRPKVIGGQLQDQGLETELYRNLRGIMGDHSVQGQVCLLSDARFPTVQRQFMTTQIGRVSGNQFLQRVMSQMNGEEGDTSQVASETNNPIPQPIPSALTPTAGGVIQCDTCPEAYGAPGSSASTRLVTDREAAKTRVRSNLNSWTPHLLRRLDQEIGNLFSSSQELAWWGNWATSLVVDLLDEAIPKPIGTAIKAMASVGEHIVGQSIANARSSLIAAADRAVVAFRTTERTEADNYINGYFERIRTRTDAECGDYLQLLYDTIEVAWPELTSANYGQLGRLATQLLERVRERQLQDRIQREYEECVRINLERPGGVPTLEEEARVREQCRRETGYTPGGRPGSPP
ncbi:MAG: hypothetical protein GXP41_11250 [Chloroflexi bacterium]|nr:hypothetical protein [Chloroflexota bacterium]